MFRTVTRFGRLVLGAAIASVSIAAFATVPALADEGSCQMVQAYADAPEIARQEGVTGTAFVEVQLGANGEPANVSIARSSGNHWLDDAALRIAHDARYTGDCVSGGVFALEFK